VRSGSCGIKKLAPPKKSKFIALDDPKDSDDALGKKKGKPDTSQTYL
jgi:hypothetical protein